MAWNVALRFKKFPDCLKSCWMIRKVSGWSRKFLNSLKYSRWFGKFPDCPVCGQSRKFTDILAGKFPDDPENCWEFWKVSGWSERVQYGLKSFRMVWKVTWRFEKFLDILKSCWMIFKVSGWNRKFLNSLEIFKMVQKFSRLFIFRKVAKQFGWKISR